MPPTAPSVSPLLLQRVVEGLKEPVAVVDVGDPRPSTEPPYGAVVVTAPDLPTLRRGLRDLPHLGRTRMVAVVLAEAERPLPVRLDPRWPALQDLDARLEDGGAVTVVRLVARTDAKELLTGVAYGDRAPADGGLVVARSSDPDDTVPPDVVTEQPAPEESPVLGRAPVAIPDLGPEPLDETLFNPVGFRRDWERGVVDLDPGWRPTPGLVARLRDVQAVRVTGDDDPRLLAALAMSGVPLVTTEDLGDPDVRERHSVRQRRAALLEHSTTAWRLRVAERAGVRVAGWPTVTGPDGDGELVLLGDPDHADDPDVVTDLVLAHRYSGAEAVEMPRAQQPRTECYVTELVGGPVLVTRALLRRVDGLGDVGAAAGSVYRTHVLMAREGSEAE